MEANSDAKCDWCEHATTGALPPDLGSPGSHLERPLLFCCRHTDLADAVIHICALYEAGLLSEEQFDEILVVLDEAADQIAVEAHSDDTAVAA